MKPIAATSVVSPGPARDAAPEVLLDVRELRTFFEGDAGEVRAVDGVSFTMRRGRILALVGESGSGKTVLALSLLRLIENPGRIAGGKILLHPRGRPVIDVTALSENSATLYDLRGGLVSMIFQEPMTALSPVHTIGNQIIEAIRLHKKVTPLAAREQTIDMLHKVGIPSPERRIDQFPHELSGGMRQRAVIAMALVGRPELLIADEATTALDVTTQAQVLGLIKHLQSEIGCSVLLVTHNMGVVAQMADDVAVMYLGRVIEQGTVGDVLKAPRHPYTIGLIRSIPHLGEKRERLASIRGGVPSLARVPAGCPFHPRCQYAQAGRCDAGAPPELRNVGHTIVACHRAEEIVIEAAFEATRRGVA